MITRIQTLNFRCLQKIDQTLNSFNILVGPNGSGKSTFLDVVGFMADLVSNDLNVAVSKRTNSFIDLIWERHKEFFEIAIELKIPDHLLDLIPQKSRSLSFVRYQARIGITEVDSEFSVLSEWAYLKDDSRPTWPSENGISFFGAPHPTIFEPIEQFRPLILRLTHNGSTLFFNELSEDWGGHFWEKAVPPALPIVNGFRELSFSARPTMSALAYVPDDQTKFPIAVWLKQFFMESVQSLSLNNRVLRSSSRPGQGLALKSDGANLPWLVENLKKKSPKQFKSWIKHLRSVLLDLADIKTIENPEDRYRYLVLEYKNKIEVPSWMVSDGTMRLLALTLPAYLSDLKGIILVEEPENWIHPRAIEAVFQSLSTTYDSQVLLATHSPLILNLASLSQILCYVKDNNGATQVVRGNDHPLLKDWRHETSLGSLLAAGVLG